MNGIEIMKRDNKLFRPSNFIGLFYTVKHGKNSHLTGKSDLFYLNAYVFGIDIPIPKTICYREFDNRDLYSLKIDKRPWERPATDYYHYTCLDSEHDPLEINWSTFVTDHIMRYYDVWNLRNGHFLIKKGEHKKRRCKRYLINIDVYKHLTEYLNIKPINQF